MVFVYDVEFIWCDNIGNYGLIPDDNPQNNGLFKIIHFLDEAYNIIKTNEEESQWEPYEGKWYQIYDIKQFTAWDLIRLPLGGHITIMEPKRDSKMTFDDEDFRMIIISKREIFDSNEKKKLKNC